MAESAEGTSLTDTRFFQDCCRGLEYAEGVLKTFSRKAVKTIHSDLQKSFKELMLCIYRADSFEILSKGWKATLLEHQCKKTPACNTLMKDIVRKLPFAFLANREKLLRAMFQNDAWEFTKLFLEPWMWSLSGFEDLDTFCLLVLLDNISDFSHKILPKINRHVHTRQAIYQEQVRKLRKIADACFRNDKEALTEEERDVCLQATVYMLALVSRDADADVAIENIIKIKDSRNTDENVHRHGQGNKEALTEWINKRRVLQLADMENLHMSRRQLMKKAMEEKEFPTKLQQMLDSESLWCDLVNQGQLKSGPNVESFEAYMRHRQYAWILGFDYLPGYNAMIPKELRDVENYRKAMEKALEEFTCKTQLPKVLCSEVKNSGNTDVNVVGHGQENRLSLKEKMKEFERMMRKFASEIPHEDLHTCATVQKRKTKAIPKTTFRGTDLEEWELIKQVLNKETFSIQELLEGKITQPGRSGMCKEIAKEEFELIQALLYSVETSVLCDGLDVINSILVAKKLTDQENVEMAVPEYRAMQNALEGHGCGTQLQTLLRSEIKATNFKVCQQTLLRLENVLRHFCKDKLALIHSEVKDEFPRKMLCTTADINDVVRVEGFPSEEIKFKHDCTKSPDCNTFLKTVLSKKSASGGLTPCTMFKNVNPQDCIDDIWTFSQLFLEPCMRIFDGLCDLDAYCLFTLFENIWEADAKQKELDKLMGKLCKVRNDACNLLQSTNREMTREEMESFLNDIMDILKKGILPGADRLIHQINTFLSFAQVPNFESTLAIESKRLQHIKCFYEKGFISERNFHNWCRIALTINILQPALLPFVQKDVTILHQKTKTRFPGNLCLDARAVDIKRAPGKSAQFAHMCHRKGLHCNTLLNEIKNITSKNIDLYTMLKDADPQKWLNSPLDFSHMFLEDWMRRAMNDFKEFDVSALCHIIIRCRPLLEKCNGTSDANVDNVITVRNRTMHSTLDIGQQYVANGIDAILKTLRQIEKHQIETEVTEAIKDIEQLKAGDLGLLKVEERLLLEGALGNLTRELEDKKAFMTTMYKTKCDKDQLLVDSFRATSLNLYARKEEDIYNTNIAVDQTVIFWIACALGLKYLRKGWMLWVKHEIGKLYEDSIRRFEGKLCSKATLNDIRISYSKRTRGAVFNHTNEGCNCNEMLDFLQEHIPEKIETYDMFRFGIHPQIWLRSHFDFSMIFIKEGLKGKIRVFEDCDISALCSIVSRCKPLKEKMDSELIQEVRNEIVHCATTDMTLEKMNTNLCIMLEFVQQLRTVHDSHELAKSEENIRQLIEEGFTIRRYEYVQMLQDILSEIKIEISYTEDLVGKLEQKCNEMEKEIEEAIGDLSSTGEYHDNSDGEVIYRKPLPEMEPLQYLHVKEEDNRSELLHLYKHPEHNTRPETRRQEEELKRKINNLKEEKRKLEEEIAEIAAKTVILNELIQRFVELENKSPILGVIGGVFGGLVGGAVGLLGGPAGVAVGVAAGSAIGASAGVATGAAISVLGMVIETHTKESCREGLQRLEREIHDRRQRISYLAREIADQERVLSNI